MANYYNTINLTERDLQKAKKQTASQEIKILDFLEKNPNQEFTKYEIKEHLVRCGSISERTPESSISRALHDLSERGKIIKLSTMRMGGLGKPNHLWKIQDVF